MADFETAKNQRAHVKRVLQARFHTRVAVGVMPDPEDTTGQGWAVSANVRAGTPATTGRMLIDDIPVVVEAIKDVRAF